MWQSMHRSCSSKGQIGRRPRIVVQYELAYLKQAQAAGAQRWGELISKVEPTAEQKSEARQLCKFLPQLARQIVRRRRELFQR
jgi:hypothetical protein